MRILAVNSFYDPDLKGGAEVMLATILKGLVRRGHEVSAYCLSTTGTAMRDNRAGIDVVRAPVANLYPPYSDGGASQLKRLMWKCLDSFNVKSGKSVERIMSEFSPDLIFTNNLAGISASVWAVSKSKNVPIVHVMHDYYVMCPNVNMLSNNTPCITECKKCAIFRMPHRALSSNVAAIIGVSEFILEKHLKLGFFSATDIKTVIRNARLIMPQPRQTDSAWFTFGYIGGITAPKGVELLLDTFQRLSAINPRIRLRVAGRLDLAEKQRLQSRYTSDRIEYVGYVDAVEFYSQTDALVVPSLWDEPAAGVLYEAAACGVPVLASNRGGSSEVIVNGLNGLIFDPADPAGLAQSMSEISTDEDLFKSLCSNAAHSVSEFMNEDGMVDRYELVMQRVLANSTVNRGKT